ncbi:MAG: trypsin-like peptidase domain-containing protein [Thermomicrobiales bacterium]
MPEPLSRPARTGIVSTLKRRAVPYLVAATLLLVVAFSVFSISNMQADLSSSATPPYEPYTVSLVSQVEQQEPSANSALSVADVAETANAAVVTVYTFAEDGEFRRTFPDAEPNEGMVPRDGPSEEPTPLGAGSGWIFTEDGYVVTNAHVVQGADSFVVQYSDGTQVEAELVGTDGFQDVAVLKLGLDGAAVPGVSSVGDSTSLRPGDEVVAIGSPLGEFTNSVSDGNIGGLDRSLDVGNGTSLDNLIQHDAEISPGNSGGPLLNMRGEVIGMNVAKVETAGTNGATVTGLNFAIDGNTVVGIAETIIANNGSIAFPYLGVQTQVTNQGTVAATVELDGPAARAGIEEGDVFVSIDGVSIDDENSLLNLLLEHAPGETVDISVARGDADVALEVTLVTRPESV